MNRFLGLSCLIVVLLAGACNEGSIVGNDLLEGEAIDFAYDDGFLLEARTVSGDSIATYRSGTVGQTYMVGSIDDPVFGNYSAEIYTGFQYGSTLPDYSESVIDSVVLELQYDIAGFYGADDVVHNMEVYRVEDEFLSLDTVYSDQSFMTGIAPIGTKSFVPDVEGDSVRFQVRVTEVDSFINLSSRINIRLDDAFGAEILADSAAAASDSALVASFKGLRIRSTPDGNSMLGLNFSNSGSIVTIINKVAVYYTQQTTTGEVKRTYNYLLRNHTSAQFILDPSGSPVGDALGSYEAGRNRIYSQALDGVNAEIDLPDLTDLQGNIINSAQLVLTVSEEDEDLYPANIRFLLSKESEDGGRVLIDDLQKVNLAISTSLDILDGQPRRVLHESGDSITTVTFYITDYVRNAINDGVSNPKVILSPVGRAESPRRTVFFGTEDPIYPAKLRIAYTII